MCTRTSWRTACSAVVIGVSVLLLAGRAGAEGACPPAALATGLLRPLGLAQSPLGNLLVAESGAFAPNTGRVSIVGLDGSRRTLLDGLPSGLNDVSEPSGPAGLVMRGRTVYLAIGVGDTQLPGGAPNATPSSPLFSSILAIHFSARVEQMSAGFVLSLTDHEALAAGGSLTLSNGGGDAVSIQLVIDFPDSNPTNKNPFALVAAGRHLYVTDGGQNLVWKVDLTTGAASVLTTFPQVANPLFGIVGPPFTDAVPTGIAYAGGQLLVALFTGVPFAPGVSSVVQVDPVTGARAPLITSLKTAIGVLMTKAGPNGDHLVLQHASAGPFFGSPGSLLRFDSPAAAPVPINTCLNRPTSMVFDRQAAAVYVAELVTGAIVAIPANE